MEIEAITGLYSLKVDRLSAFAYENVNSNNREVMIKFAYYLSDVIDIEQTLIDAYDDFIKENRLLLENEG